MKTVFPSEYKEVKAIMDEPVTELPDGVMQAKQHLMRSSNLLCLCVDAVDKVLGPHVKAIGDGSLLTPALFQSMVASLFIEASHMRFVEKMPSKPIK